MSWLLEIVHETRVHYQGAARASYNEARMTPLTLPSQTALQTRVSVGNGTPGLGLSRLLGHRGQLLRHPGPA